MTTAPPSSPRIVLFDDHPAVRAALTAALAPMAFDLVQLPPTLALITAQKPDVLILASRTGTENLRALCRQLVSHPDTAALAILIVAPDLTPADQLLLLEAGALDVFTLPLDPARLHARIHHALRLKMLLDLAHHNAMLDPLTGLWNRAYYQRQFPVLLATARRTGTPLACILLDLDNFKAVNDTHGHLTGDAVLRHLAHTLAADQRAGDVLCRYGGEEFVILAPLASADGALIKARRHVRTLAAHPYTRDQLHIPLTVSIGLATATRADQMAESLFAAADAALYQAKHAGGNCIHQHPSPEVTPS